MKRYMIDIESIGKQPGGVILSVGLCRFNTNGVISEEREWKLDIQEQMDKGLTVSADTLYWWLEQPGKPWRDEGEFVGMDHFLGDLDEALEGADEVWAKPPQYDLAAISMACQIFEWDQPWHRRAERCLRTLKQFGPKVLLPPMAGSKHGALDDAIQQAKEAGAILRALQLREERA